MTDTNQASELLKLCKNVYELTGWDGDKPHKSWYQMGHYFSGGKEYQPGEPFLEEHSGQFPDFPYKYVAPLYTSDYLLEKLPVHLKEGTLSSLYELDEDGRPWCWGYHYDDKRVKLANGYYAQGWADTPLKALLNLVIKLDKGGVKL